MTWKEKPKPRDGDERIVARFLFRRVTQDGICHWLKFVKIRQRYCNAFGFRKFGWTDWEIIK